MNNFIINVLRVYTIGHMTLGQDDVKHLEHKQQHTKISPPLPFIHMGRSKATDKVLLMMYIVTLTFDL